VSRYRVIAPMIAPAAFVETMKVSAPQTLYHGDIVSGADQRDLDRLVAGGFLEVLADVEPVVDPVTSAV
jgi:hypothetical protein